MSNAKRLCRNSLGGCAFVLAIGAAHAEVAPPAPDRPSSRQGEASVERKPEELNAQELGKEVTGVFVNSPVGQGGYAPEFMFRGFPNGGLTLYDGAARGFISGIIELAGVERTEFVKGAASLLYGTVTSATGAAANYVTKTPERSFFVRAGASVGSFGFHRMMLDVNTPLNAGENALFRLNVAVQEQRSFVDFVHNDHIYVNTTATVILENGDRLSLRGEYTVGHFLANYGIPTYIASPLLLHLPRNFYAADPSNGRGGLTEYDARIKYEHDFNKDWNATILVDYSGGARAAGWLTDWRFDGVRSIIFGNGARTHGFWRNFDAQASVKGRFETGFLAHNVFFGFEHWRLYDRHRDRVTTYKLGSLEIFTPVYSNGVDYALAPHASGNDSGLANSVFAQDLIDIGPQLSVLGGARYDRLASFQTIDDPAGVLTGSPRATESGGFYPKVSLRAGVIYRPLPGASIHAAWSKSLMPNIGVRLAGGKLAPPEEDTLYELGIRQNLFDRKIELDLGVFDIKRDHVPGPDPFNPNGFYWVVSGQQHSHGVEASGSARLLPNFRIGVAATFLHTVVSKDSNTPSQRGSDLLGAPRRIFNLSASYRFDHDLLNGLEFGASFYYASETQATLPNTRGFTLPPIKNLTVSATYKLSDHLSLLLTAANLTDVANFTSNGVLLRGEPRTMSASINYTF